MTKLTTKMFSGAFMVAVCAIVVGATFASPTKQTTTVEIEVLGGDLCVGSTGSFDFGDFTVSNTTQTVTGVFTDYFWVEDLKGADSGYYTTLQLSGDLAGPAGATIPAANVFAQTSAVGNAGITTMTGSANTNVEVAASMAAWQEIGTARTLIKRDPAVNNGLIGQYGTFPELRVDIPAYTPVGTYTATLCYTIYEN